MSAEIYKLKQSAVATARKVDLDRVDMVAMAIIINAADQIMIIADALRDTGRPKAAVKFYEAIFSMTEGHSLVVGPMKERLPT